jgi:putative hydrolase of the HAD superfamily
VVEVVIDSHRVGVEKPDPAIFGFALRAMGLDPARCLYLGDSVRIDVAGARAAGLTPALVTPDPSARAGDFLRVRSLAELLARL